MGGLVVHGSSSTRRRISADHGFGISTGLEQARGDVLSDPEEGVVSGFDHDEVTALMRRLGVPGC